MFSHSVKASDKRVWAKGRRKRESELKGKTGSKSSDVEVSDKCMQEKSHSSVRPTIIKYTEKGAGGGREMNTSKATMSKMASRLAHKKNSDLGESQEPFFRQR